MDAIIERGATSIVLHVQLRDAAGAPVTGLAYNTAGLACRYQRDAEPLSGDITLQDIAALGTYAAPTANTNLRFKEVDATNWPGLYEIQLHSDWLAVSGTKRQLKILLKHSSIAQQVLEILLVGASLQATAVPANLTQIDGTASASATLALRQLIVDNSAGAGDALQCKGGSGGGHGCSMTGTTSGGEGLRLTGSAAAGLDVIGGAEGVKITAATKGIVVTAGGINNPAVELTGIGSGAGLKCSGGATGHGVQATGGASGGSGLMISSSGASAGLTVQSLGAGATGVNILGGAQGVLVLAAQAGGNGLSIQGNSSGAGVSIASGTDGHGLAVNVSGTGNAIDLTAGGTGYAIEATASGNDAVRVSAGGAGKHGVSISSGTDGDGIRAAGNGAGHGMELAGGATGHGVRVTGGSAGQSGDGVSVVALGAGQAVNAVLGTDCITSSTFASGAISAAALADDAIDAAALATDAVSEIAGSVLGALSPYLWTHRGTAQSGATQGLTLDAAASATNHLYRDSFLFLTSGTGAGQVRQIISYDGATRGASVDRAWDVTPNATTTFAIIPFGRPLLSDGAVDLIADEPLSGHATANTLGNVLRILATASCTLSSDVHRGSILGQLLDDQSGGSGAWSYAASSHSLEAIRKRGDASWTSSALDTATKNSIADHVLRRAYANARLSADGDPLSARSLLGAIARLVNYLSAENGLLTVRHEDDVAVFTTAALTTSASASPVTAINPA